MTKTKYSPQFKIEAVKMMLSEEKPVTLLAKELNVRRSALYRWKEEYLEQGELAFKVRAGRPKKEEQSKVRRLESENRKLTEELEILKKAAAYFAR
jgi:transposase